MKKPVTAVMLGELLRLVDDDFPLLRPAVFTNSNVLGHSEDEVRLPYIQ